MVRNIKSFVSGLTLETLENQHKSTLETLEPLAIIAVATLSVFSYQPCTVGGQHKILFQEIYTDCQPHLGMRPIFSENSYLAAYGACLLFLSVTPWNLKKCSGKSWKISGHHGVCVRTCLCACANLLDNGNSGP